MLREKISLNIRLYLHAHQLTQLKFSEQLGIPNTTLANYLNGKATISKKNLEKFEKVMNVPAYKINPVYYPNFNETVLENFDSNELTVENYPINIDVYKVKKDYGHGEKWAVDFFTTPGIDLKTAAFCTEACERAEMLMNRVDITDYREARDEARKHVENSFHNEEAEAYYDQQMETYEKIATKYNLGDKEKNITFLETLMRIDSDETITDPRIKLLLTKIQTINLTAPTTKAERQFMATYNHSLITTLSNTLYDINTHLTNLTNENTRLKNENNALTQQLNNKKEEPVTHQ